VAALISIVSSYVINDDKQKGKTKTFFQSSVQQTGLMYVYIRFALETDSPALDKVASYILILPQAAGDLFCAARLITVLESSAGFNLLLLTF